MKELISKVYENKMSDGTFEKIVSEQFEKMVKEVCGDLFGWKSEIQQSMKNRMGELMSSAIESSNFNEYTVKMQAVINETIKNSTLADYKTMLDGIKSLCGIKEIKFGQQVKITEIFEKYTKFVKENFEEYDFNDDEINTDEDDGTKKAYLNCYLEVEEIEEGQRGYFAKDKKIVKLTHAKAEDRERTIIEFELIKDYKNDQRVHIDANFRVSELRYLPSFIIYLLSLEQGCAVIDIDTTSEEMEIQIDFED